jgi:hypothetical protein
VPPPARGAEPGLHLVIGERGTIVRSAPIRNAPRDVLQPPFLSEATVEQITTPLSELVLNVLGRDGRVLDSFGWPWTAEAFYDTSAKEREGVRVGRVASLQPLRLLRVPIAEGATFLLFSQTSVMPGEGRGSRAPRRTGLTLYSLVSPIPPRPRLPEYAAGLRPRPLPGRAPLLRPN